MGSPLANQERATSVAGWILVALVAIVPLAMTNLASLGGGLLTYDVFQTPKLAVLCAGTALVLAALAWSRPAKARVLPKSLAWPLLAFALLAVVSTIFGLHVPTALFGSEEYRSGLVSWAAWLLLFLATIQLVRSTGMVRRLLMAVTIPGVIVAIYGLMQSAGLDAAAWSAVPEWMLERGLGTIGNPDMLGGYLLFPLLAGGGLALSDTKIERRWVWWVCTGVVLAALTVSAVRGAWIAAVVGLALLAYSARLAGKVPRGSARIVWIAAAVVVALAFAWSVSATGGATLRRVGVAGLDAFVAASNSRLLIWQDTAAMIAQRPILGTGPDTYLLGWWPVRSVEDVASSGFAAYTQDAHNYPLTLAATLGIPAAILLVGWFGYVAWRGWRWFAKSATTSAEGLPSAAFLAAVVAYLAFLMLGVTSVASSTLLWVGLGVVCAPLCRTVELSKVLRASLMGIAVISAVGLLVFAGRVWAADAALLRSYAAQGPSEALSHAETAVSLAPWQTRYRARLAESRAEVALAMASAGDLSGIEAARASYREYLDFVPRSYEAQTAFAAFLNKAALVGGPSYLPEAADLAIAAYTTSPTGLAARVEAALALSNAGRTAEAITALEDWWDIDPTQVYPGVLYGELLLEVGRTQDASVVSGLLVERFTDRDQGVANLRSLVESATAQ